MGTAKNIAKNILSKGKTYVYHKEKNIEAKRVLKIIEAEKGKLDSKNMKLCNEYAKDMFGDEKYAPWLYVFCAYAQEFKEGWIPDNYYGAVVVPKLNGEYGQACNRNAIISTLIEVSDSLDICYYTNHLFLNTNCEIINESRLKEIIFSKSEKVVYKLEDSLQGKGIHFFDKKSFDIDTIKQLGNGVFQNYIEQHSFFSEFTKSSVATIRLTTTSNNNGDIDVRAGYLRFGRENETHVQSASAMKITIDIKNGKLFEDAHFPNWSSTKQLPGNDISFAGKVIPSFNDCLAEVKRMHKHIPFVRCIGWDIIVDKNNKFNLIELNGGHNGINFSEMVYGPCFKDLNWESLNKNH